MGIQGFFNYIKNIRKANGKYNSGIFKNDQNRYILDGNNDELKDEKKTYDFLFLDFQSGIYQTKNELKEYDYLVRLIHYVKFKLINGENILYNTSGETQYRKTVRIIFKKFYKFIGVSLLFCSITTQSSPKEILEICESLIIKFKEKTTNDFIQYLVDRTFINTINIILNHGFTDRKDKVYIFFDGIPTVAKLKEQIARRIEPNISMNIQKRLYDEVRLDQNLINTLAKESDKINTKGKTDLNYHTELCRKIDIGLKIKNNSTHFNIFEFESYLSDSHNIPIGIGTEVINKLIQKFEENEPDIYINELTKYGEAEHQIMRFIVNNSYKPLYEGEDHIFWGKKILLSSPDADLILLGMIMNIKGYFIDIYRFEFISDDNFQFFDEGYKMDVSPYKIKEDYILIDRLINTLFLNSDMHQANKILDFAYILLILGDDFLPTIPNISSKNIDDIYNV
jgi:hypothetical protein